MEKEKAIKWWIREYLPSNLFLLTLITLVLFNGNNSEIILGGGFFFIILSIYNGYSVYHYKKMVKGGFVKPFGEK